MKRVVCTESKHNASGIPGQVGSSGFLMGAPSVLIHLPGCRLSAEPQTHSLRSGQPADAPPDDFDP